MAGGGPRTPANPAPVSGPGALSRRTDGQAIRNPGDLAYGDNAELRTQQAAAPMAGTTVGSAERGEPPVPLAEMSPSLFDPTNYPDRPVTTGMPFGPGPGSEVLAPQESPMTKARLANALPTMMRAAESPYVTPEFRAVVSMLRRQTLG